MRMTRQTCGDPNKMGRAACLAVNNGLVTCVCGFLLRNTVIFRRYTTTCSFNFVKHFVEVFACCVKHALSRHLGVFSAMDAISAVVGTACEAY